MCVFYSTRSLNRSWLHSLGSIHLLHHIDLNPNYCNFHVETTQKSTNSFWYRSITKRFNVLNLYPTNISIVHWMEWLIFYFFMSTLSSTSKNKWFSLNFITKNFSSINNQTDHYKSKYKQTFQKTFLRIKHNDILRMVIRLTLLLINTL